MIEEEIFIVFRNRLVVRGIVCILGWGIFRVLGGGYICLVNDS